MRVEGLDRLRSTMRAMPDAFEAEMRRVAGEAALLVRNDAVKSIMTGARSGRVYRRKSVKHQASAPGEPPKTDTGRLAGSITWDLAPGRVARAFVRVALGVGKMLELGTAKMAARPFLHPAVQRNKAKIEARFVAAARAFFRRQGRR